MLPIRGETKRQMDAKCWRSQRCALRNVTVSFLVPLQAPMELQGQAEQSRLEELAPPQPWSLVRAQRHPANKMPAVRP